MNDRLPRLVYRNSTPEVMAWSIDVRERATKVAAERWSWAAQFWDAAGVPEKDEHDRRLRQLWVRDSGALTGLNWPRNMDDRLPAGWFRPVKEDHLVRPRGDKKNAAVIAEMKRLSTPDQRQELGKFGMPGVTFAGSGLYSCSTRHEDDGVWVGWASKDVEDELNETNRHRPKTPAEHGWVKVPLVEYLQRFGEDDS